MGNMHSGTNGGNTRRTTTRGRVMPKVGGKKYSYDKKGKAAAKKAKERMKKKKAAKKKKRTKRKAKK
jgi:hypothetical protein